MRIIRLPSGNYRIRIMVNGKSTSYTASTPEECEAWYNARKNNSKKPSREYAVITTQIIEQQNTKRKKKWDPAVAVTKNEFKQMRIPSNVSRELQKIDEMSGEEFEKYIIALIHLSGCFYGANISSTKKSGDFGADVVVECINGERICIQCKRMKSNVGIDAIQEVYTSQQHYRAINCAVITNSYFTKAAVKLANDNGVTLVDRKGLNKMIELEILNLQNLTKKSQWTNFLNSILEQK